IRLRLGSSLRIWLGDNPVRIALPETEFALGPRRRLKPDLALLPIEKWAQSDFDRVPVRAIPDIVVEIVSPSETAVELDRKIRAYREAGVSEVWVAYPGGHHVDVYSANPLRVFEAGQSLESELLPGWSI